MNQGRTTTRPVTIAVLDDHDVIHAGVHLWRAQARPPIRIAADCTTLDDFTRLDRRVTGQLEVVVVDLELTSRRPDFGALEEVLRRGHRAVVYSHLLDDEIILRCLDLGAASYITKAEGKLHLLDAIRAAANDLAHTGPRMAGALSTDRNPQRPHLTERETEALIAWFQTENKELVAQRLGVSPATVKTYLQRARARNAAAGRPAPTKAAMVARAIQDGIISVDEL